MATRHGKRLNEMYVQAEIEMATRNLARQHATCPLCESRISSFVRQLNDEYSWWQCHDCDLRFSWPMRGADEQYYQSIWSYSPKVTARHRKRLRTIRRIWDYRKVLEYQPTPGGRLLDIGCGTGEFLYLARERYGYRVSGLDFNEQSVSTAKKLYGLEDIACGSWPEAADRISPGAFARVTMFHVLEHVADPVQSLRSAATALGPDGLLCVAVPARLRRPSVFAGIRDLPPHHLTLWSERALAAAFWSAGLEPLVVARAPFVADNLLVHWQERFPVLQTHVWSRLVWIFGRRLMAPPVAVSRWVLPMIGCTIVGVARRPKS